MNWQNNKLSFRFSSCFKSTGYRDNGEEAYRQRVFMKNVEEINKHNQLYDEGLVSFSKEINQFADMEANEISFCEFPDSEK